MRTQQLRGRTALTIPFLVGSLRSSLASVVTTPETVREEISALLHSFLEDAPADHAVSIYRCLDIGQPVAIQFFSRYSIHKAVSFESRSQNRPTLFVAPEFVSGDAVSLAALTQHLFMELHSHICAARFSHVGTRYVCFTTDDRAFIEFSRRLPPTGDA